MCRFMKFTLGIVVCSILLGFPQTSQAVLISGNGPLGYFTGELIVIPIDTRHATLTVSLKNTSPVANGGYLTAFVLNNPGNRITAVDLASTNSHFRLLGGPSFNNSISASPYSNFDIGAGLEGQFLGGGLPQDGISVGETDTFSFRLTGNLLDELTENSFESELAGGEFFLARFRGFNNGDSNKTPGEATTPEPATLTLLGLGLLGLTGKRIRSIGQNKRGL